MNQKIRGLRGGGGIGKLYQELLGLYGEMGWWPVRSEWEGKGYHPGVHGLPRTREGAFEVCMGAVLTQNTAWTSVEKALDALSENGVRTPEDVLALPVDALADLVRPSGYRNQKSRYLREVAQWFIASYERLKGPRASLEAEREKLLTVKGVGPETADSILLYAFHLPSFVIDAYTRRVGASKGLFGGTESYACLRSLFMEALPLDVVLYQEYHALLVQHAKLYHRGKICSQGGSGRPEAPARGRIAELTIRETPPAIKKAP